MPILSAKKGLCLFNRYTCRASPCVICLLVPHFIAPYLSLSLQDSPSPPECPFVQYRTCKRRTLRAASLPRLVKWLVSATAEGDLGYIPSFLATYRAFTTAEQVLEMLLPLGPDK